MSKDNHTDILVIGAGPAGLTAAAAAARDGARVMVIEKMKHPARKLCITGKGRCNITNASPVTEHYVHIHDNPRFLRSAFNAFFHSDIVALLHNAGVETVVERGDRVFPAGNQASDIANALIDRAHQKGVLIRTGISIDTILTDAGSVTGAQGHEIVSRKQLLFSASRVIVATGGISYPSTGSTGDGYLLARKLGHTTVPTRPALVPLVTGSEIAQRLMGLTLKNVTASLWADNKKITKEFGEMLFAHFGLTGPIILTLSRHAVDARAQGKKVRVTIDLKPALDEKQLDKRLLRDLETHSTKKLGNIVSLLLPARLVPVCLEQTGLSSDKPAHQVSAQDRKKLRVWLKKFSFDVKGPRPFKEAIITAGGIALNEISSSTMQSKIVSGLFFCGEVIDLDADTGGYNLQIAFSTGHLAGLHAAKHAA